ncbi:hypothetical protein ACP3S7_30915 [Phytobacter ursingii]
MKAIGKWRFIKEREDRAYRTGRHDDFEVLTAGIGENSSSGIKLDGSTYHVNHDCLLWSTKTGHRVRVFPVSVF